MLAHVCSFILVVCLRLNLQHIKFYDIDLTPRKAKNEKFELNLLKSATLACLLMLAHVCSFILVVCWGVNLQHLKLITLTFHEGEEKKEKCRLSLLKSATLANLLMLAHACSCLLTYSFLSPYKVSWCWIIMWRIKIGKFGVKPVKISGFSMVI